jgi:hypothetical protein
MKRVAIMATMASPPMILKVPGSGTAWGLLAHAGELVKPMAAAVKNCNLNVIIVILATGFTVITHASPVPFTEFQ